jgi:FkbM family methyltransferase
MDLILSRKSMPISGVVPTGIKWLYDVKRFSNSKRQDIIFDVGAFDGDTVSRINQYFPESRIFAFEPVKKSFNKLRINTGEHKNIHCFNIGMGSKPAEKEIYIGASLARSSLLKTKQRDMSLPIERVAIDTIDNFCDSNQIQYLNILKTDTEGYDLQVLQGAAGMLKKNSIQFIYSEFNFDHEDKSHTSFQEIYDYLKAYNCYFCGFYDVYFWGGRGERFGFCNGLFMNSYFKEIPKRVKGWV